MISEAFNSPFFYPPDADKPHRFCRLPMAPNQGSIPGCTLADLAATVELRRRKRASEVAMANGVKRENLARFVAVAELEAGEVDIFQIDNYARSAIGAPEVCRMSLRVSGLKDDEIGPILIGISPVDMPRLAAFAVGTWNPAPSTATGNPQSPPDAGGSTGSETAG